MNLANYGSKLTLFNYALDLNSALIYQIYISLGLSKFKIRNQGDIIGNVATGCSNSRDVHICVHFTKTALNILRKQHWYRNGALPTLLILPVIEH